MSLSGVCDGLQYLFTSKMRPRPQYLINGPVSGQFAHNFFDGNSGTGQRRLPPASLRIHDDTWRHRCVRRIAMIVHIPLPQNDKAAIMAASLFANRRTMRTTASRRCYKSSWLPDVDSNHDWLIQSQLSYH